MTIGQQQRAALIEIVELLSPGSGPAQARLARTLDDTSETPTPEEALFDALADDSDEDADPVLTLLDWKDEAEVIRDSVSTLPTYPPGLSWDWYDWSKRGDDDYEKWDSDDLSDFLSSLHHHCAELGFALIGFWIDDGFTLGFVRTEKFERLEDAASRADTTIIPYY